MTDITAPATAPRRFEMPALGALFALSGAAALIYQVLWVRELGLLFGSTAQAAALTIAIFFAGIALGAGSSGASRRGWGGPCALLAWSRLAWLPQRWGIFW